MSYFQLVFATIWLLHLQNNWLQFKTAGCQGLSLSVDMPFKLSSVLMGHSLDARSVTVDCNQNIISGSRDKTVKLWRKLNETTSEYANTMTYRGHTSYVSAVCVLPPSPEFLDGCLISGGNDKQICVYDPNTPTPLYVSKTHTNTVCNLKLGVATNTILSCSWDCTAKLLLVTKTSIETITTFTGHEAAVWAAIQLPNLNVVTGGADKDIIIWLKNGSKKRTLKGHTDCVRDLVLKNENQFLSAANDSSIRVWSIEGECISTFYGHSNYIYSICIDKFYGEDCFVTSSEDKTVKFWKNGECVQTIALPAQSIWSVCTLANGDIVTGSSDGVVRVFTQDEKRMADPSVLKAFEEEVNSTLAASEQKIGGVKISDLPGREVLYEPGKTDGQTKLVREGASVVCYSWSAAEGTWNKIGDVLGANEPNKTLYEGKEYDFVFSVDIEEGKPPLKLPYNKGEDPWQAAQAFIYKNDLSQMFLDQIANFIIKNSGENTIVQSTENAGFADPFTGGSRYVPSASVNSEITSGANVDPFTGASSYSTTQLEQKISKYFPQLSYLRFDQGNTGAIFSKLKEFNAKVNDSNSYVDEAQIENFVKIANEPITSDAVLDTAFKMLEWPVDMVFPVLDVIRLAVKHEENNIILTTGSRANSLVSYLKSFTGPECTVVANQMLSYKILANLFSHQTGEMFVMEHDEVFLKNIETLPKNANKNTQIAVATFLLNLSVALTKYKTKKLNGLVSTSANYFSNINDPEAEFRCLVALGTIISDKESRSSLVTTFKAALSCFEKVLNYSNRDPGSDLERKCTFCANDFLKLLG